MSEVCRHHVSKKIRMKPILLRFIRSVLACCSLISLTSLPATAGGLSLYEIATSDVGLASAGWAARAQDPATLLKNPAGMSRLEGNQFQVERNCCRRESPSLPPPERRWMETAAVIRSASFRP